MSNTPEDTWFYTCAGEKIGPVTFSELRVKAHDGSLNPRLDLVWGHGMAEWKPSGEIDGLFERRPISETLQSVAPAASPYQPPAMDSAAEIMAQQEGWPGARRRSFLIATLIFPIVWQIGLGFAGGFANSSFGPEIGAMILFGAALVPMVIGIYYALMRLVNLGMSRWWYLANFVPFLNLWVGYRCFACPAGYANHKKLDGIGVALAIFYWLMVAIVLLAVVALAAIFFGAIANPEIKKQLEDFILSLEKNPSTQ